MKVKGHFHIYRPYGKNQRLRGTSHVHTWLQGTGGRKDMAREEDWGEELAPNPIIYPHLDSIFLHKFSMQQYTTVLMNLPDPKYNSMAELVQMSAVAQSLSIVCSFFPSAMEDGGEGDG